MSISSENIQVSLVAYLSAVTVSGSWLDSLYESEVRAFLEVTWAAAHAWHGCGVPLHIGRYVPVMHIMASSLLFSHHGPVGVEALVCVLNDEGVLHLHAGWTDVLVVPDVLLGDGGLDLDLWLLDASTLLWGDSGVDALPGFQG